MEAEPFIPLINDFRTERLNVHHWSNVLASDRLRRRLVEDLVRVLSPAVLTHLPPSFQVQQKTTAVSLWIDERSAESDVFLVEALQSGALIGLLILVNNPQADAPPQAYIGYLLAEEVWGKGYASELIAGLVQDAEGNAPITLLAGVAKGNGASARVLRKQGFTVQPQLSDKETEVFARTVLAD